MKTTNRTERKRRWRRTYIVDHAMQHSVAAAAAGYLLLLIFFYVGALFVLPEDSLGGMTGSEAAEVVFKSLAVFMVVSVAGLWVFVIQLTHRVAGPARVIETAIREMGAGRMDARLTLRTKDHLKSIASALEEYRGTLVAREELQGGLLDRLEERLRQSDVSGALEVVDELRRPAAEPERAAS